MFSIPNETLTVSGNEVILKDCYFYLLYKRKGDETTQIPILMDKEYDSGTDTISASFEPTSYFTELNGGMDIQVFACSTEQDFVDEDVDIEDVALWTTFNAQISIAKSQLKNSQTIVAEDMFTKGIAEMSAYLDSAESEADDAEEYASDAEEFARGTRSDGLTVPHASTGTHDNAKDYKELAKDWASKIGGAVESGEYSAKYYAVVSDTRSQEAEAYAVGTKGGTPVPAFADKNAKDWATKTGSTVDGTNYSSKQYAFNAKESADIVEEHATAIDAIYADLTNIDAVATDIQDDDSIINTVAENIQDVNAVAESITDVNTVAGKTTQITTVAGIASDVTTVAGIASDVTAVAGIASDVSAVEDIKTDVSAVASIDDDVSAVASIKDDVSAVATIDDDVTTVATDISDVSAVASDITKVTAVADDLTNIDAVADDLTNIDNAEANALKAEGWANGTQNGTPVSSDSPYYENNAKYWADAVPDLKDAIRKDEARITNLEEKADPTGAYKTVNYRGTNAVPTGKAKYALVESIVGKSRAWNQMAHEFSSTYYNLRYASLSDGVLTFSSNTVVDERSNIGTVGHVFLLAVTYKSNLSGEGMISNYLKATDRDISLPAMANWSQVVSVFTCYRIDTINFSVSNYASGSLQIKDFILRDLTLIFPEGVPSTVAECVQKCPDILTYDAFGTSIVDTTVEGVKSKARNLLDPAKLNGAGTWSDGVFSSTAGALFDFTINEGWSGIEFLPSTRYYLKVTASVGSVVTAFRLQVIYTDGTTQTSSSVSGGGTLDLTLLSAEGKTIKNVLFNYSSGVGGTVQLSELIINVSDSQDGIYTHYWSPVTLTLPSPVTLRSAGSVADTDELNVEVIVDGVKVSKRRQTTKVGHKNLGECIWSWNSTYSVWQTQSLNGLAKPFSSSQDIPDLTCIGYKPDMLDKVNNRIGDKIISGVSSAGNLRIYDSAFDENSNLNTLLDGVIYNYEKIEESVTLLEPIENNTIQTEGGGTINTIQNNVYPDESPAPTIDNSMDVGYLAL